MAVRSLGVLLKSAVSSLGRIARMGYSILISQCLRARGVEVGRGCTFYGVPRVNRARRSRIVIGDGVAIRSGGVANPLSQGLPCVLRTVLPGATLTIGDRTGISSAVISCWNRIEIARDVLVGAGALITDSDAHIMCAQCREAGLPGLPPSFPVQVGAGTFIGGHSAVLKGACLGAGCVVGYGSVVTRGDYAAGVRLVGVPASENGSGYCEFHQSQTQTDGR